MTRTHHFNAFLALGLAFACCTAQAAHPQEAIPYVKVQDITTQQAQIRADVLAKRGRYATLTDRGRDQILSDQDVVLSIIAGKTNTSELSAEDRVQVFNLLEQIQGIVNNAEQTALICTREKPLGSNFPKRVCMTAADRDAQTERARVNMVDAQNH